MFTELAYVKPANIALPVFEEQNGQQPVWPFYTPDEDISYFNDRHVNNEFVFMLEELNINVSHTDIMKSIKQLQTSVSGGPDKLINNFFIHGMDRKYIDIIYKEIVNELDLYDTKYCELGFSCTPSFIIDGF